VIALQRRGAALGWALCLTAAVAFVDYVVVTGDRRAARVGRLARAVDAPVLHAAGAGGLGVAGVLALVGDCSAGVARISSPRSWWSSIARAARSTSDCRRASSASASAVRPARRLSSASERSAIHTVRG